MTNRLPQRLSLVLLVISVLVISGTWRDFSVSSVDAQSVSTLNCDLTLGTWKIVNPAPTNHGEASATLLNNKLYVFGGFDSNAGTATNRVDVFNLVSNRWETATVPLRPMPFSGSHVIAVPDGQYAWFVGGFIGNNPGTATNAVWKYDSQMDLWYPGPPLPAPRAGGAVVRYERTLHYLGGTTSDRNSNMSDHWTLNLDDPNATWQTAPSLPNPRNHAMAAVVNNRLYVMGGQYSHDYRPKDTNLMHMFNPATNQWTRVSDLAQTRSHFEPGTVTYAGRIIIVGGENKTNGPTNASVKNISEYNPLTDTWREVGLLPYALLAPAVAIIGDRLVVTEGGYAYNHLQKTTYTAKITLSNCVDPNPSPTPTATYTATSTATEHPTLTPTDVPTDTPTNIPTELPTDTPTDIPTELPTELPTDTPTDYPTTTPTELPTDTPTDYPTTTPTELPTDTPTDYPTTTPTELPTHIPTETPIGDPVVGDFSLTGNGAACTEANLEAALAIGGTITFDCPNPTTITITHQKIINLEDVTLDGGTLGKITLDGQGITRLFKVENAARTLTLQNLRLTHGYATDGGGAIYTLGGTINLTNTIFMGNLAANAHGGAVYISSGQVNITNSTFDTNSVIGTGRWGGAIYGTGANVRLNISRSTFSNNAATGDTTNMGGALALTGGGKANIANTTFAGNSTTGYGGAIRASSDATGIYITASTFSGNSAYGSSAINRSSGTISLRNSILANKVGGVFCGTAITDGGGNIVHGSSCAGITAVSSTNPLLGALTGSPAYFVLSAGSPAIDKVSNCTYLGTADNPLFSAGAAILVDQAGAARPSGAKCDIGASEYTPHALVMLPDVTDTQIVTLNSPADTALVNPQADGLVWTTVPNAQQYKLVIKRVGKGKIAAQIITPELCAADVCQIALSSIDAKFKPGRAYTWHIIATTPDGKIRSETRLFTVQTGATSELSSRAGENTIPLPVAP